MAKKITCGTEKRTNLIIYGHYLLQGTDPLGSPSFAAVASSPPPNGDYDGQPVSLRGLDILESISRAELDLAGSPTESIAGSLAIANGALLAGPLPRRGNLDLTTPDLNLPCPYCRD
jgi:hypothetical protein